MVVVFRSRDYQGKLTLIISWFRYMYSVPFLKGNSSIGNLDLGLIFASVLTFRD